MNKYLLHVLFIYLLITTQAYSATEENIMDKNVSLKINITSLEITDKIINLCYQFENNSEDDIWLCEACDIPYRDCEVFLGEDGQTIVIRKRINVPLIGRYRNPPLGQYIRLRKGEKRNESILCTLPIYLRSIFTSGKGAEGIVSAKQITIEVGYFPGSVIDKFKKISKVEEFPGQNEILPGFDEDKNDELNFFNYYNESLGSRDEQISFYALSPECKEELVLSTSIKNLNIPYLYQEKEEGFNVDMSECTKLKIQFNPSLLEYFFPYTEEQNLLSISEKEYLISFKTLTLNKKAMFNILSNEIEKAMDALIVTESSNVRVICFRDSEILNTFLIYNNGAIESGYQRYGYYMGFDSLRKIASKIIQPFDLRMRCANNLKNLWYCMQLYNIAQNAPIDTNEYFKRLSNGQRMYISKSEDVSTNPKRVYPMSDKWCDSLLKGYRFVTGPSGDGSIIKKQYICPSTKSKKCNYAMNPNCKPDSPDDMVLLFETKNGWNKYGGPKLFTFDNHDPKGGCILLNDGTVKFIRTKEELNNQRWK